MACSDIDLGALKSRHVLSAIVGRRVKLRRAGHEQVGFCPFHTENTPSFRVNDTRAYAVVLRTGRAAWRKLFRTGSAKNVLSVFMP